MAETNRYAIIPAEVQHIREVARRMRKQDAEEIMASGGYTPLEGLRAGFWNSHFASTAFFNDEPAGMFGVLGAGTALGGVAVPWLLTTEVVDKYPVMFFKVAKMVISDLLVHYPVMMNMIDARHKKALAWATKMGWQVDPPIPFGVARLPFCRVTIRRSPCASLLRSRSLLASQ